MLALHRLHHLRRVEQLLNLSITKRTRRHLLRRQSARYTLYLGRGLCINQILCRIRWFYLSEAPLLNGRATPIRELPCNPAPL